MPAFLSSDSLFAGKKLTDKCRTELAGFKADLGSNINKNIPLGEWQPARQHIPAISNLSGC